MKRLRNTWLGIFLVATFLSAGRYAICHAEETPSRLFFSDARLSFIVPEAWDVPPAFPIGPILSRKTSTGPDAFILCQISNPVSASRISSDISTEALKSFATHDLETRASHAQSLATSDRKIGGLNAYEVTWQSDFPDGNIQNQSEYFFMENRYYVITFQTQRDTFAQLVPEFQQWVSSIQMLSREGSGKLAAPSHGGLWVHQTAGAKIPFSEEWLVGVADDRQVGATIARDKMHLDFTAVADVLTTLTKEILPEEKVAARRAITAKGYAVTSETEDPFHGYPAFQINYEGTIDGRFVRGKDLWVASPKARWLISLEGDGAFFRQNTTLWQGVLNGLSFL
jgi:hypothetical protein